MSTWVKLYRKINEWEWYKESEMVHLFLHLILSANHKEGKWKGITIEKGQLVTGRKQLSLETGISERTIRTCINRLKSTSEIALKTTNKFSIITICKYDDYQANIFETDQQNDQLTDQQLTSKRPTNDQQLTTNKNNKNNKNDKNNKEVYTLSEKKTNFFEIFHLSCPDLPKVLIQSEKRKKMISSRISEFGEEKILEVFRLAGESDFLNGKNDRQWKADFDWILNPTNFIKILENKFKNKLPSHENFKPNDPRASQTKGWDIPL